MLAVDQGTAAIMAAAIAAIVGPLMAYLVKVHKDNRGDHAVVAELLADVHADVRSIKADLHDVKADVRELRGNDQQHEGRLYRLEHPTGGDAA